MSEVFKRLPLSRLLIATVLVASVASVANAASIMVFRDGESFAPGPFEGTSTITDVQLFSPTDGSTIRFTQIEEDLGAFTSSDESVFLEFSRDVTISEMVTDDPLAPRTTTTIGDTGSGSFTVVIDRPAEFVFQGTEGTGEPGRPVFSIERLAGLGQ